MRMRASAVPIYESFLKNSKRRLEFKAESYNIKLIEK